MPFERPTLSELSTRITGDIESSVEQTTPILRKSVLKVFGKVFAGAVHLLFGFLDFISRQVFPDTAESEYLDRWSAIWGVVRKASTFSEYDIDVTGSDGSVLPSGSTFQSVAEIEYLTQSDVTISGGVGTVHVVAVTSGTVGNLETGDELTIVYPVAGIDSTGIVASTNQLSGVDEEDDESLRDRLIERIQNPPQGGSKADYIAWAKEVSGVTRAWCYPTYLGPGTVGVTFTVDDDPVSKIPDSTKVDEVKAYIDDDSRRPVNAVVTVFAPVEVPIDFTIQLNPDSAEIRANVEAELDALLFREGYPGGVVYLSQIREAISTSSGEIDSILTNPVANVSLDINEIATIGTITWV